MDVTSLVGASDDGWAMVLGAVDADGRPWATRAWSIRSEGDDVVRVAIDAHDHAVRACLGVGAGVAVTAGDVRTLESAQVKGRSEGLEPPDRNDLTAVERNVDRLVGAIEETDLVPRRITRRFVPGDYVVCRVRCSELFDQSPGPDAGARLPT